MPRIITFKVYEDECVGYITTVKLLISDWNKRYDFAKETFNNAKIDPKTNRIMADWRDKSGVQRWSWNVIEAEEVGMMSYQHLLDFLAYTRDNKG